MDAKDDYRRLRQLSAEDLWNREVPIFEQASEQDRVKGVAVIRAVGVVFSESGTVEEKQQVRDWLRKLLNDPQEKIRRYATNALPKLGSNVADEAALLGVLEQSTSERERKALGSALSKIGGERTLAQIALADNRTAQKIQAKLNRSNLTGSIHLENSITDFRELDIILRCRRGLESILAGESETLSRLFRLIRATPGQVVLRSKASFRLADLFELRCFATLGFRLGIVESEEAVAGTIVSNRSRQLLNDLTAGPVRYRLSFPGQGHRRGAVRKITDEVYRLSPELLNDASQAPWQIDVWREANRLSVELMPRLRPDPRFAWRRDDVPAASHPPLAAAMARLAGPLEDAIIWDPFCGSGLELIECSRLGGVTHAVGTDLSESALSSAEANFAAALPNHPSLTLGCGDFRDFAHLTKLRPGTVSLIVSNPPMGRRVPVPDMEAMIMDLFEVAAKVLKSGGHLVFANPLPCCPRDAIFRKEFRQKIDLGGFHVHLEKYSRR